MGNPPCGGIARGRGCCGSSNVNTCSHWSWAREEAWLVPKNLGARLVAGAGGHEKPAQLIEPVKGRGRGRGRSAETSAINCLGSRSRARWAPFVRNLTDGGVFLSGAYAMGTVVVSSEFGLDLLAGAYAMGTSICRLDILSGLLAGAYAGGNCY